ncbi:hypothetical protein HDU96_008944 [Phlyctochytrium bullatum]|nr:hypothetical protein HDU96_008944 [Phlyctochytrium bullatum]
MQRYNGSPLFPPVVYATPASMSIDRLPSRSPTPFNFDHPILPPLMLRKPSLSPAPPATIPFPEHTTSFRPFHPPPSDAHKKLSIAALIGEDEPLSTVPRASSAPVQAAPISPPVPQPTPTYSPIAPANEADPTPPSSRPTKRPRTYSHSSIPTKPIAPIAPRPIAAAPAYTSVLATPAPSPAPTPKRSTVSPRRAAQNREAQRNFRRRRKEKIQQLEAQVRVVKGVRECAGEVERGCLELDALLQRVGGLVNEMERGGATGVEGVREELERLKREQAEVRERLVEGVRELGAAMAAEESSA